MPGKVSVEPTNGVFGDDRVGAMMAKYDADKSGSFNAEECARPHVATHTADSLVHDPPTALTRIPPCFPAHRIDPPHRPGTPQGAPDCQRRGCLREEQQPPQEVLRRSRTHLARHDRGALWRELRGGRVPQGVARAPDPAIAPTHAALPTLPRRIQCPPLLLQVKSDGTMLALSGEVTRVDTVESHTTLWDMPAVSVNTLAKLKEMTMFVDMSADPAVGGWVEATFKVEGAYKARQRTRSSCRSTRPTPSRSTGRR